MIRRRPGAPRASAVVALAVAGLTLGGCLSAPVYGPMGGEKQIAWGYSEIPTADGGFSLRVERPDDPDLAHAWWMRRAAELCPGAKPRTNIHTAIRPTLHYDRYGGMPGHFVLQGYVYCEPAVSAETPAA